MMMGDYLTPGMPGQSMRDGAPQGLAGALGPQTPEALLMGMQPGQQQKQDSQFGKVLEPGLGGLMGIGPMLLKHGLMGLIPSMLADSNTGMGRNFSRWLSRI